MADLRTTSGVEAAAAAPAVSKKQRRKQQKTQWLADRKVARASASASLGTPSASAPAESDASPTHPHPRVPVDEDPPVRPRITYAPCPSGGDRPCGHSGARRCRVRIVDPYVHTFACSAKRRWCGRPLLDLFRDEFGLSASYCDAAVRTGLIRVNGTARAADYVLKDGDRVAHIIHRHEPVVHIADGEITTAGPSPPSVVHHETADIVVVNKPSGIPVHPSGPLLHNSLTQWLTAERPLSGDGRGYFPVHRLDRLTSGLTLLATSAASAAAVGKKIADRAVRKHYMARVHGVFPAADPQADVAAAFGPQCVRADGPVVLTVRPHVPEDGPQDGGDWWRLEAPIECLDSADQHRRSVGMAHADRHESSKPCETLFRVLRTVAGGRESVVECVPVTGRTHQLRVHLQFLGFPIVNDPLYRNLPSGGEVVAAQAPSGPPRDEDAVAIERSDREGPDESADGLAAAAQAMCARCRTTSASSSPSASLGSVDYADETQALWLHAFRYRSADWDFCVPLPAWAAH